eukprot:CAMPEP_0197827518 /NCGR_PEP_ID=MMETSP1437-20131217/4264_1 /TAXON_ID=49252 ORGANISM="Eucampia antarctica, Strain CCMP1452" /NCGR_SAMPLE_ID=MMETSP1437 /ASSEMBLY_ACC=CAM_ASM_001096 /LENGTH=334 /DNA_ID=CAMNT_0043428373 /DNA_START=140 /DNA_END=1144 /DNA_ORIENTATION=+
MDDGNNHQIVEDGMKTRRSVLSTALTSIGAGGINSVFPIFSPESANAAIGSLPEFTGTDAILQGLTVNVADPLQQNNMIDFLLNGFNFKILRRRQSGSITDTWLGFGPEQLSIPSDFEIPVSPFAAYGGHASIHIRYDSQAVDVYYNKGELAPGDNIAFVQVAVPDYRISQMVQYGGNVIDAFGYVNVVSPSGLPFRGIVGISPDPIMFVAINCQNIKQCRDYYQQLGFVEQEYPYSRPSNGMGQFEPLQPKGSAYLAPSPNCMGVLLLQAEKRKKKIKANPAVRSLNIVYTPTDAQDETSSPNFVDPSYVPYSFGSVSAFDIEEKSTRYPPGQ